MSIRILALFVVVVALGIYAWKDWFKSLCGLILLMAVIEHEDMPRAMFGIAGLNPWNVLFGVIFVAWLASRRREGLRWDMPSYINVLLLMYLGVILIGAIRTIFNLPHRTEYLIIEGILNTVKWVLPAVLLFDGCRTRKQVVTALVCLLAVYFLISVQVIRNMPLESAFGGGENIEDTRARVCDRLGYSACDTSTFLAGASWGILAALQLVRQKKYKLLVLAAAGIVAFGQALTGGRAGYLAWAATGLVLCLLKWRKYLLLAPIVVILLPVVLPGIAERMLTGFGVTDVAGQGTTDLYLITSGRTRVWTHAVDKIGESPMVGYGRLSMARTGLTQHLFQEYGAGEAVSHPHNMYLGTLLDNGILGSLPIFLFWATVVIYSSRLFRSNNRLCSAVGGVALAMTLAQLFGGIGAQSFYPRESRLGVWAAMFLSLRVYLEWARVREGVITPESSWNGQLLQQQ